MFPECCLQATFVALPQPFLIKSEGALADLNGRETKVTQEPGMELFGGCGVLLE
jgi:hypothetical protein